MPQGTKQIKFLFSQSMYFSGRRHINQKLGKYISCQILINIANLNKTEIGNKGSWESDFSLK